MSAMAGGRTIRVKVDDREFKSALRQYSLVYHNKLAPDILNQAAKDLAFEAYRTTAIAPKGNITRHKPDTRTYPGRLLYAIQNPNSRQPTSHPRLAPSLKGSREKNAQFLYNMRMEGRKYIAIGWLAAAYRLGVSVRTRLSAGVIRGASATPATPMLHRVTMTNGAYGSAEVGAVPLQRAMKRVAVKKRKYAQARLEKLAKRFSGR